MAFANIRFLPKSASVFDNRSQYGLRDPSVETPAISASSQASASLGASNVVDDLIGRPWRSSGNFVVVADVNDVVDFKESAAGAELHAALTAGTYTPTTLATEIKARMEAASGVAATYTVSYSATTGKWTISTSHTYLALLFATGQNAATNPAGRNDPTEEDFASLVGFRQHPSANGGSGGANTYSADFTGAISYTGAVVACHTEEWVKFEFNLVQPINCLGLFGHNLTEDAVVTIEANVVDDFGVGALIPFSQAVTWKKEGMALFSSSLTHSTTQGKYKYFLVRIKDPENPDFYVQVGRIMGGVYTEPQRNFLWGYAKRRVDTSLHFATEGRQRLTKRRPQVRYFELAFEGKAADYSALDAMFDLIGQTDPLMVALGDADADAPPIYGYLAGDWAPARAFIDRYEYSLALEEAV